MYDAAVIIDMVGTQECMPLLPPVFEYIANTKKVMRLWFGMDNGR